MPAQYFRLDGGRLTLAECWCLARSWAAFAKFLAWKPFGGYPFRFSIARPDVIHRIDPIELPSGVRDGLLRLVAAAEAAGLGLAFVHRADPLERSRAGAGAVLLDPTGTVIGTVAYSQAGRLVTGEMTLTSHFTDGTAGATTTARRLYREEPHRLIRRHPGLAPAGLLERHRGHLADWEQEGKLPRAFPREALQAHILAAQQRRIDFYVDQGLFVPMTDAEVERARGGSSKKGSAA